MRVDAEIVVGIRGVKRCVFRLGLLAVSSECLSVCGAQVRATGAFAAVGRHCLCLLCLEEIYIVVCPQIYSCRRFRCLRRRHVRRNWLDGEASPPKK